jgi:hypothetical protein
VADDIDEWVGDGSEHAVGHLRFVLIERRVDRCHDHIELRKTVVGEIHGSVSADIALDAGEQGDAFEAIPDFADTSRMCDRAMLVEAVRHRKRFAVIGNRQILESRFPRRQSHRFDVFTPVGFGGVRVDVAANVLEPDEVGQRALFRRFKLAARLPQLGRDLRQTEGFVNLRFGPSGHERPIVSTKEAVLVQFEPVRNSSVSQRDVMRL